MDKNKYFAKNFSKNKSTAVKISRHSYKIIRLQNQPTRILRIRYKQNKRRATEQIKKILYDGQLKCKRELFEMCY